jgi:hypothetical protein
MMRREGAQGQNPTPAPAPSSEREKRLVKEKEALEKKL